MEISGSYRKKELSIEISYSLSKTRRLFSNINNGQWFSPPFDIRNKLDFTCYMFLTPKLSLAVSQFFQSGNFVTIPVSLYYSQINNQIIPIYKDRNNFRLPAMHRLDISMQYLVQRYNVEWRFTVGAYNVYNQSNPYFVYFKPLHLSDGSIGLIAKKRSLLPLVPFFMMEVKI